MRTRALRSGKISTIQTGYLSICLLFVAFISATAVGQTPDPTPEDEPDFIVPARPTVSNPAEFQRPGVLQLEFGYNANYHSNGNFNDQEDAPLALRFAVSRRILLELDTDSPYTLRDPRRLRNTGVGDTQLGIQAVLLPEKRARPGVAFAYYIKIPTASASRGLGSGRVDHAFLGLVSKTVGKTTFDFNAIYLLAGRTTRKGLVSSGQAAFAVTQNISKHFGVQGEISGVGRNDLQAAAMFGLGVVTYQLNSRVVFDGGLRFGLTPGTPQFGVVAGITVGIANLYKKRH